MKKNTIIIGASMILFLSGISNLIRIFYDWDIKIISKSSENIWELPLWGSFLSAIITLFLAYNLIKIKNKR
ncbi:MAG: hypothetical protein P8H17_03585 [Flavobacteriales bacterium]|nr:hypothetical protein [Flavobacteriales bacterium]